MSKIDGLEILECVVLLCIKHLVAANSGKELWVALGFNVETLPQHCEIPSTISDMATSVSSNHQ